jgi:hypothetical protein
MNEVISCRLEHLLVVYLYDLVISYTMKHRMSLKLFFRSFVVKLCCVGM